MPWWIVVTWFRFIAQNLGNRTIYYCIVPMFLAWNEYLLIKVQTYRYTILPFPPLAQKHCFVAQNLGNKGTPRDHDPPGYFRS